MAEKKADRSEDTEEDLEKMGLIAHSYDSLFAIRRRMRAVSDIKIPLREGLMLAQVGVGALTLMLCLLLWGLLVRPALSLVGISFSGLWVLSTIAGLVVLSAQQALKPMPHGKSIPGTGKSWLRHLLDDPVHRRGRPMKKRTRGSSERVPHWQRQWVLAAPFTEDEAGHTPLTTPERAEHYFDGDVVDLQGWMDDRSAKTRAEWEASKRAEREIKITPRNPRGPIKSLEDDLED